MTATLAGVGWASKSVYNPPLKVFSLRSAAKEGGMVSTMLPFTVRNNESARGGAENEPFTAPFTVVASPDPPMSAMSMGPLTLCRTKSARVPFTSRCPSLIVQSTRRVSRGTRRVKS